MYVDAVCIFAVQPRRQTEACFFLRRIKETYVHTYVRAHRMESLLFLAAGAVFNGGVAVASRLFAGADDKDDDGYDKKDEYTLERTLKGHTDNVWSVTFSPDGTRIASGSWDKTVCILDYAVDSVAFSPDGTRLASGSDNTVCLWDATTGEVLQTLEGHTGQVESVAFSPDGARLASASDDGTVRLWHKQIQILYYALDGRFTESIGEVNERPPAYEPPPPAYK